MRLFLTRIVIALRIARDWFVARSFFAVMSLLQRFPADKAIDTIERWGRALGMRYPRTARARENLQAAFPDKSPAQIEQILRDMWGNLARTAAEYAYLDQIFDFDDSNPDAGRFEVVGIENFAELIELDGPAICFTGHTGNWELLPVGAAAYGLNITALFRPPNNRFIAERVLAARTTRSGHLVPSKAGAAWALSGIMEQGGKVGLLVDQYYRRGVPVEFFGRKTLANPLLGKLVRQFDCPVYPARCIRLPGGRFRLEIQPALEIPRRADGSVDTAALTQRVTSVVEDWVREYPAQWLWLHKRWQTATPAARERPGSR